MKNYKNVEMFAKNAPSGSYAAGCPEHHRGSRYSRLNKTEIEGVYDAQGVFHEDYDFCRHCELFN